MESRFVGNSSDVEIINTIKRSVFVEAREWFDKTGGVTYFSARIWVDGRYVATLPFQNGYHDQYLYEAQEVLAQLRYINSNDSRSLSSYCYNNNIDFYTTKSWTKKSEMFKEAK